MQEKETHAQRARDWLLLSVSRVARMRNVISRSRVVGEMFETEVTVLFRLGELGLSRDRARMKRRLPRSVALRRERRGA